MSCRERARLAAAAESHTKFARVVPQEEEDPEAQCTLSSSTFSRPLCCRFIQPEQGCNPGQIPVSCRGCCVFLPVWAVLESLEFHASPFFQAITCESLRFRDDPKFQKLVRDTAEEVLKGPRSSAQDEARWKSIRDSPHLPPNLDASQFGLAFSGIADVLNKEMPTQIRVWNSNGEEPVCVAQYGSDRDDAQIRIIDIFCNT